MSTIHLPIHELGFAEHSKPGSEANLLKQEKFHNATKWTWIAAVAVASVMSVLAGLAVIPMVIGLAVAGVAIAVQTGVFIKAYLAHREAVSNTIGIINRDGANFDLSELVASDEVEVSATASGMESHLQRIEMVKRAEKNIVLSGNFCKGQSFDELLDIMKLKLEANPDFKIVILAAQGFLGSNNQRRLDDIQNAFPDRFNIIRSGAFMHVGPGIKFSMNHVKCLTIDDGKEFILGGSGADDKYSYEYQAMKDGTPFEPRETEHPKKGCMAGMMRVFQKQIIPNSFVDMDFVFKSKIPTDGELHAGAKVHQQMLRLAYRWEQLTQYFNGGKVHETMLAGMMREEITPIEEEAAATPTAKPAKVRIFATGPEHAKNPYLAEMINRVEGASKRIFIDHLYYHPPKALALAIRDAVKRGVEVTISTNGLDVEGSPLTHFLFAPRNRNEVANLLDSLTKEERKLVHYYEMSLKEVTLHTKVMVVDDAVLAGSGNIGDKSLKWMSDSELNFIADSKELADQTVERCTNQLEHSKEIKEVQKERYFMTRMGSALHRALGPWIG